jgi:outer membrane protein TolC
MPNIRRFLVVLCAAVLAAAAASAQEPTPPAKLTLKQAVQLAVQNSRDIQQARLQAIVALKTVGVDRSQFRPNLYTGSGYEYTSGFPLAPGGSLPALFELSYNQAIYDPLAKGHLLADQERVQGQDVNVDAVRDSVIAHTATSYFELSKVRHSLELLRKGRESAQKITDATRDRVAAGYQLPIEQTRSELASARIEQRIAQQENRADELEGQLRDTLGLLPDQPIELVDQDLPPSAEQPTAELVTEAISNDPGLKQAEAGQRAADYILKGTRRSLWPSVALVGNYSVLSNTNNFSEFFNKFQRNNVNAGVQIEIPIFAAKTHATISEAEAEANAAAFDVRNKRGKLELHVRAQARQLRELELSQDVARLELKLAQQNQGVIQAQFDQGRATLSQLEQAQLDENDKWLAFLDAGFARQQAQLALLQTTGQVARILQ